MAPTALRLSLVALALVAAGCDGPVAPERTNPFDPETTGERQVSRPTSLEVVASSPTSVTLEWDDPNSFEAGFEVVYGIVQRFGTRDDETVRLPPNTTRVEVGGLIEAAERVFRVRALGEGDDVGDASPPQFVTYPIPSQTAFIRGRDGLLVPGDQTAYRASRPQEAAQINVFALVPDPPEVAASRGRVPGYDRVVGRASADEVAVERVVEGAEERAYALIRRTDVRASGVMASPAGAFEGPSVVAADGSAMAAVYLRAGGVRRLLVWDPRTGAVLDDGEGSSGILPAGAPLMISRAGTVVFVPEPGVVAGWDPGPGAEAWRLGGVPGEGPLADPAGDRFVIRLDDGTVEVFDADGGGTLTTIATGTPQRDDLRGVAGRYVVLRRAVPRVEFGARRVAFVYDLETGDLVRSLTTGEPVTEVALDGDDVVLLDGSSTLGLVTRLPLFADWSGSASPSARAGS